MGKGQNQNGTGKSGAISSQAFLFRTFSTDSDVFGHPRQQKETTSLARVTRDDCLESRLFWCLVCRNRLRRDLRSLRLLAFADQLLL